MNQRDFLSSIFLTVIKVGGVVVIVMITFALIWGFRGGRGGGFESSMSEAQINTPTSMHIEALQELNDPDNLNDTADQTSGELDPQTTEDILENTAVPQNDLYQLAEKYRGIIDVPVMLKSPAPVYENGTRKDFWVLNVDANSYRPIEAAMAYQTPHVYFWVEEGVEFNQVDVERLADVFEAEIYPLNRMIFGEEFSPGVDNDRHLTMLYADALGGAAGYFSATDSYMTAVEKYSNQTEMFYMSTQHVNLSNEKAYGVMAHEFQHMIHWNADRDESAWINEGLSELAVDLNGYNLGGFTYLFAINPDLQLNFWPGSAQGSSAPHYGASYLFAKYLYEQFGNTFIRDLVEEPGNGFKGLEAVLRKHGVFGNEEDFPAETLFQRWTVANMLNPTHTFADVFGYKGADTGVTLMPAGAITCGDATVSATVKQFGTDYYEISCDDDYEIRVEWDEMVQLLPADPHSGKRYFWSNRGDESVMHLSREFDLRRVETPIILSYYTWYDIEPDYDYLYLNISENGSDWENLQPSSCTREDPTGANYGCGYNGKSGGWVLEEVDLSTYAGKKVTLQFEYVTDMAVNGEGFIIDDIEIGALDYREDFEYGDGGWGAEGFVLIENTLTQRMGITFLREVGDGRITPTIQEAPSQFISAVEKPMAGEEDILILSGLTQYTHIPAQYKLSVERIE